MDFQFLSQGRNQKEDAFSAVVFRRAIIWKSLIMIHESFYRVCFTRLIDPSFL